MFSQNITVNSSDMPSNVVACGDEATFAFNVFGPLAAGSEVTLTLPSQSSYASLVSGDVTVTVVSPTQVKFKLNNALANSSSSIKVEYKVNTSCSAMPSGTKLTYVVGSLTKQVDYPSVQYSLLEVTSVTPTSSIIAVNATQNYSISVKQSANTYSNNVKVQITHSTKVSISTAVGTLTVGTPSSGMQTDVLELTGAQIATIGDNDTQFEFGEILTSVITAKLIGCTSGETIGFKAAYGCGTFTACATGNTTNIGLSQTPVGTPSLTMTQTKAPRPGMFGQTDNAIYTLRNSGTGNAMNVSIRLGFSSGGGTYFPNKRNYLDFTDFKVNGNSSADNSNDQVFFQFTTDPDGIGVGLDDLDGDGFYDDLAPGKTVTITALLAQSINVTTDCLLTYNAGSYDIMRWRLIFSNVCGVLTNYDEPNNSLGTNRPFALGNGNVTSNIGTLNNNLNFSTGSQFNFIYQVQGNYYSIYPTNVGASDALLRIKLELPLGVIPNTSLSIIRNNTSTFSMAFNSALSSPSSGIYYYDLRPLNNSADLSGAATYNFPLIVDSTCNTNGVYSIKASYKLYEKSTDTTPYLNAFMCTESPSFTLNCATPIGMGIDVFDAYRTTLGFTDSSMTTPVTASTSGIDLNAYVDGDKGTLDYSLTIYDATLQEGEIKFEYDQSNWLQHNLNDGGVKGIEGTHTDPVTGVVTPFAISVSSLATYFTYNGSFTGSDGKPKSGYTFNVLKLFSAGEPLNGLSRTVGTEINYKVNFKLPENFTIDAGGAVITGVNSYTNLKLATNTTIIGNYQTDLVKAFCHANEPGSTALVQTGELVQCAQNTRDLSISFNRYNFVGDFFPNEFRLYKKINKAVILLPKGISYVPGSAIYNRYSIGSTPILDPVIEFGFNIDGTPNPNGVYNKYSFTNTNWPHTDMANGYDITGIYISYTVNNLITQYLTFNPTNFVSRFVIDTDIQYHLNLDTPKVLNSLSSYSIPSTVKLFTRSLTSSSSNVTTATNSALWNFTLTNTNAGSETIPNNWVSIEVPNNNITPTLWEGATQIPLVSYGAGKYWAQLGNLTTTARNFEIRSNSFTVCGTESFVVKSGFDCLEYPIDPTQGYTSQGNVTPYTQNINMSLTTQDPSLTSTSSVNSTGSTLYDICTSIDESVTITNGANGFAYNVEPQITLPVGMSFVNGTFKVTYNGTDYAVSDSDVTLISGTTYKVNIYNSGIPFASSGLPGTSSTSQKFFVLSYKVSTLCTASGTGDYISGSRINYTIQSKSGCGSSMPISSGTTMIRTQPINLNGAPTNKVYSNTLESLETDTTIGTHNFSVSETLKIEVVNQGDPTLPLETIKVFVDDNYNYVANSTTTLSGSAHTIAEPTTSVDASGQRVITWTIPTPFVLGQTIKFTFEVKIVEPLSVCQTQHLAYMNTYIGQAASCALNGETCNLQYPTGTTKEVTLKSEKASDVSSIVDYNATVFAPSGNSLNYSIVQTITNNDTTEKVVTGLYMKVYVDTNKDGLLDAGDVLVNTHQTNADIAASGTLVQTISGIISSIPTHLLVEYVSNPNVSDICNKTVLSVTTNCYVLGNASGLAALSGNYVGISTLNRNDQSNWVNDKKNAALVLESNNKGFVISRVSNVSQILDPKEGMIVFDTTVNCLKLYANGSWNCVVQKCVKP